MTESLRTVRRRHLLAAALIAVIVASVATWLATRDTLPDRIRIAAAQEGGLYHAVAVRLAALLHASTGLPVDVIPTSGSIENQARLAQGDADLALLQTGTVEAASPTVAVAPLFDEPVHVIVRRSRRIETIRDLAGRSVALGLEGSGMRRAAEVVLAHYRVEVLAETRDLHFDALRTRDDLDGAIVTAGLLHAQLAELLAAGEFRILAIEDAEAICVRTAGLRPAVIPRGLYSEGPAVPDAARPTIAATAFVACRAEAPGALVTAVLDALHGSRLRFEITALFGPEIAQGWDGVPAHRAVAGWHDPYQGLGLLADGLESMSAVKELLFALGLGLFLLMKRWRRLAEAERQHLLQQQKDRLDEFLQATIRIEREQAATRDPERLRAYLAEVIDRKLEALDELTAEDLRGDQAFSIFLDQCALLMRHIQSRIHLIETRRVPPDAENSGHATPETP